MAALEGSRDVSLVAYMLPKGQVLDALCRAAHAGAHVRVRLEGDIYKDDGGVDAVNRAAVAALRAGGADASIVHPDDASKDAMVHAKAAVVDGALFLDDRNWPDDGEDTIVRADSVRDGSIAWTKRESLASEAKLLEAGQRGDDAMVESESFGASNRVFDTLDRLARDGAHVRLLVCARDLQENVRERKALEKLLADGVAVRTTRDAEKFAVLNGARAWIGSANATAAFAEPDQSDWGARTDAPDIVSHLRSAFDARWAAALRMQRK